METRARVFSRTPRLDIANLQNFTIWLKLTPEGVGVVFRSPTNGFAIRRAICEICYTRETRTAETRQAALRPCDLDDLQVPEANTRTIGYTR